MKKNLTELVFILDKSGSMEGMVADSIGGFNSMIEKQKKLEGEVLVSTVLFSNFSEVLHDRCDIGSIEPMTKAQYEVGGCTALYDAIGGAIHHIGNVHKYVREEDRPEHTIIVITTDGMENASRNYSRTRVREMIKRQEKKYGWEFLFVAANIDAGAAAEDIGIRRDRAANYRQSTEGMMLMCEAIDSAVTSMRTKASIDESWKEKLD